MRELVGQGKPFYSALDKAAGLLRRKVGTGSEFLKELMSIPGVKQAEIAERGLGELLNAPKMTHEQFMAALSAKPAPAIGEKVLGEQVKDNKVRNQAWDKAYEDAIDSLLDNGLSPDQARQEALELADERINRYLPEGETQEHRTHHGQWTLPGGENYREMLVKAPQPQDYTEEIMGAHAKLRRIPYHGRTPEQESQVSALAQKMRELEKKQEEQPKVFPGVPQHFGGEPGILASMRLKDRTGPNGEKLLHLEELQSDWHQKGRERGYMDSAEAQEVENKSKQIAKQRRELVNELTKHEHEHGFISPEMQSRWNAFKEIEDEHKQKTREVNARVPNAPFKKNWEEMALKRLIHHAAENGYHGVVVTPGKEQANRYPREDESEKIAQEKGMKAFYDKKVPNILNSIGKKYGVKTELHAHPIETGREEMVPDNAGLGQIRSGKPAYAQAHYFPITEAMRQDVKKNGIPLYKSGGSVPTH